MAAALNSTILKCCGGETPFGSNTVYPSILVRLFTQLVNLPPSENPTQNAVQAIMNQLDAKPCTNMDNSSIA